MSPHDDVVSSKAWDSALIKRLLVFARPHARLFCLSFLVILALFALDLAGPYVLRAAIDGPVARALGETSADAAPGSGGALRMLLPYALLYLAITAAGGVFRYMESAQLGRTGQAVIHDLRTHLFRHLQRMDLSWFDRRPTGALVTRVTGDIESLNELFTSGLIVLVFDCVKIVAILIFLFTLDAQLAWYVRPSWADSM